MDQQLSRRDELAAALDRVERRLAAACAAAGRPREEVVLVAVSKGWPASDVLLLAQGGTADFGEARDQEASVKAREVAATTTGVRWHFVGQLQTNKAASVASYAALVQSLDRPALADALDRGARRADRRLDVLVQVRLSDDPGRGGVAPQELAALAEHVARLPGLRLQGVMAVAPLEGEPRAAFDRLAELSSQLRRDHPDAATISAGMSGDLEVAVAAGADVVRVGTALFGRRPTPLG